MSKGDPSLTRLGYILAIFVFMIFLFACKSVLLNDSSDYEVITDTKAENTIGDSTPSVWDAITVIGDFVGFFFGLFLFQMPSLAWYFNIILVPIYVIMLMGFWGLILDFIFDIADLIPFVG